ncbi:Coumaroyl-CoA:anthocyanidin 3-O-glucoside-6''-O-coumaroyltransferase 2, partial [Mucuna pruriens]
MVEEMNHPAVNIIELSQVAPPPASLPSTTLPLTFLDVTWFISHHARRIFFYKFSHPTSYTDKVRATFIFSREQAEKLKKWLSLKCNEHSSGTSHISTFVVTCSLMWVCMVKSEAKGGNCDTKEYCDEPCYFGFSTDCHDHPQFLLPSNYFGNCLVPLTTSVKKGELVGPRGIVAAANAIERKIRDFKSDALRGAETLMSDFVELVKSGQSLIIITGSPKLSAYNTDFGWGKPVKSEVVNLDSVRIISLTDCRDKEGGVQVGIALERIRINNFTNILEEHLSDVAVRD